MSSSCSKTVKGPETGFPGDVLVKWFKGHSGCLTGLYQGRDGLFVRKISKDANYNTRLKEQMLLQAAHAARGIAPHVYGSAFVDGIFYFDMEYINGSTFAKCIENMDFAFIGRYMFHIFSTFSTKAINVIPDDTFKNKLNNLSIKLSGLDTVIDEAVRLLRKSVHSFCSCGSGHGDLTLENIIITEDKRVFFIDFLDSFFHSWKMDCAKLLQDLELKWSWRNTTINANLIININYARKLLLQFMADISSDSDKYDVYTLLLLNVLRIIPYCHDETSYNWCLASIVHLMRIMEGADQGQQSCKLSEVPMNTLIVPCAGKSSRFPDMRPKWMLTHPDGSLMVEKAISGLPLDDFDRIILTIVRQQVEQFDGQLVLQQAFAGRHKVEICVLENFTTSVVDTVLQTINKMDVHGSIAIKDSDGLVCCHLPRPFENGVAGLKVEKDVNISNLQAKSFLIINDQDIITNIVEKQIVSQYISLGLYCFSDVREFVFGAEKIKQLVTGNEIYISHIISYLISQRHMVFHYFSVIEYADWGTIFEWREIQKQFQTYFIDIDGVLMYNSGKYGTVNWENNSEFIQENIELIRKLQQRGAQIVLTTSRPERLRPKVEELFCSQGINPHAIVMGLNHAPRTLINDFAPSNPYPSATAISLPRNGELAKYLKLPLLQNIQ